MRGHCQCILADKHQDCRTTELQIELMLDIEAGLKQAMNQLQSLQDNRAKDLIPFGFRDVASSFKGSCPHLHTLHVARPTGVEKHVSGSLEHMKKDLGAQCNTH